MAPQYKLTYFNFRGLAEFIRFLFAYGDIEYEDNRLEYADWPKLKDSYPNKKLPVLETEGQIINQSTAIARFVAKKVGLAGSNDFESMLIDSAVGNLDDMRMEFVQVVYEPDPELRAKKMETFEKETIQVFLPRLESQVKSNGGYLVGGKFSWADIFFAAYSETYVKLFPDIFKPYPELQSVVDKVFDIPSIKAWVSKRPKTEF